MKDIIDDIWRFHVYKYLRSKDRSISRKNAVICSKLLCNFGMPESKAFWAWTT